MKLTVLALAVTLGLAAGCDRNKPTTPPSPKTDSTSSIAPSPAAGGSAPVPSSANNGSGNRADGRNGANPHSQQVDPNSAVQRRDFESSNDGGGPQSADAAPRTK